MLHANIQWTMNYGNALLSLLISVIACCLSAYFIVFLSQQTHSIERIQLKIAASLGLGFTHWVNHVFNSILLHGSLSLHEQISYFSASLTFGMLLGYRIIRTAEALRLSRTHLLGSAIVMAVCYFGYDYISYRVLFPKEVHFYPIRACSAFVIIVSVLLSTMRLVRHSYAILQYQHSLNHRYIWIGSFLCGAAIAGLPIMSGLSMLQMEQSTLTEGNEINMVGILFSLELIVLLLLSHFTEMTGRRIKAIRGDAYEDGNPLSPLYLNNPDGVFQLDLLLRITQINHAMSEVTGYTPDELIGQSLFMIVKPGHASNVPQQLHAAFKGAASTFDAMVTFKNREAHRARISIMPIIEENKVSSVFGIARFSIQK